MAAIIFDLCDPSVDLFNAVSNDSWVDVERALKNGADPATQTVRGETPLHWAMALDSNPVENPKCYIVRIVTLLLEAGADINAANKLGQTPLHKAVIEGYNIGADLLLRRGADMNVLDRAGTSPYSLALSMADDGLIRVFKEHVRVRQEEKQKVENERQRRFNKNIDMLDKMTPRRPRP